MSDPIPTRKPMSAALCLAALILAVPGASHAERANGGVVKGTHPHRTPGIPAGSRGGESKYGADHRVLANCRKNISGFCQPIPPHKRPR